MALVRLPSGCRFSQLIVIPNNWEEKDAPIDEDWVIHYRFYDDDYRHLKKYKKGKVCRFKGMNGVKTLKERQHLTRSLITHEIKELVAGYNPIQREIEKTTKTATTLHFKNCLSSSPKQLPPVQGPVIIQDTIESKQVSMDTMDILDKMSINLENLPELKTTIAAETPTKRKKKNWWIKGDKVDWDNGIKDIPLTPDTAFPVAINLVRYRIDKVEQTERDIKSVVTRSIPIIIALGFGNTRIIDVTPVMIDTILDKLSQINPNWTNRTHTYFRSHLGIAFAALLKEKAVRGNPVAQVASEQHLKAKRPVVTTSDRIKIQNDLPTKLPDYWRYLNIFFHSGIRGTESLKIKKEDVCIERLEVKVRVGKGRKGWRDEIRPIKLSAVVFWKEILAMAKPGQYLFSHGFVPSSTPITNRKILSTIWRKHIKLDLNILADFYTLKHSNTDLIAQYLNIEEAAGQIGTSGVIARVYAHGEQERANNKMKERTDKFDTPDLKLTDLHTLDYKFSE